jgi:hypothetical protein
MDKLESIESRLDKLEKVHRKRNLPWKAAIPPKLICHDIVTAYDGNQFNTFEYEMQRLSEFYGIPVMDNRTNAKKVPAKAIACYYSMERTAYYKKSTTALNVLLHEFFHHLHAEGVVFIYSNENEEKCADSFAQIVINRGLESL